MPFRRTNNLLVPTVGAVAVLLAVTGSVWLAWQPCAGQACEESRVRPQARANASSEQIAKADEQDVPVSTGDGTITGTSPVRDGADSALEPRTLTPEPANAVAAPAPPERANDAVPALAPERANDPVAPEQPAASTVPLASSPATLPPAEVPAAPPAAAAAVQASRGAANDLSGAWLLSNEVSSTSYAAFRGLRLAYRVNLEQQGTSLAGSGVKWAENGRTLPAAQRTPISFEGSIKGSNVSLRFTEQGSRRNSRGLVTWELAPDGREMRGTFSSTAASSSGTSRARRVN